MGLVLLPYASSVQTASAGICSAPSLQNNMPALLKKKPSKKEEREDLSNLAWGGGGDGGGDGDIHGTRGSYFFRVCCLRACSLWRAPDGLEPAPIEKDGVAGDPVWRKQVEPQSTKTVAELRSAHGALEQTRLKRRFV